MKNQPPRLAQRLLAGCLPEPAREAALGDLEEEFHDAARSRLWYWRQALALAAPFVWERVTRVGPPTFSGRLRDELGHDLRSAWRGLMRTPGFTLVAVATLALGVGANTAIFSVVHAVLLRPLPFPAAEQLVLLHATNAAQGHESAQPSPGNFLDWRARQEGLAGLAAWYRPSRTLRGDGQVAQVETAQVAGDFFRTLGVTPALG